MRALWRKLKAWRAARRERYSEHWNETKPYDGRTTDQYLPPVRPDSLPPSGGGAV